MDVVAIDGGAQRMRGAKWWSEGNGWRTNRMKQLIARGNTFPEVAAELGTTVGAICGKAARIKCRPVRPAVVLRRQGDAQAALLPADADYFAALRRARREEADREGLTIALEASEDHHCRYVIGDPAARQICGVRRRPGSAYCEDHYQRCRGRSPEERDAYIASSSPCSRRRTAAHFSMHPMGHHHTFAVDARHFEVIDAPAPEASAPT